MSFDRSSTPLGTNLPAAVSANLSLTRPPDASSWTIQSLSFAAPCGTGDGGGGICSLIGAYYLLLLDE